VKSETPSIAPAKMQKPASGHQVIKDKKSKLFTQLFFLLFFYSIGGHNSNEKNFVFDKRLIFPERQK
jgi:hypothetical protein